MKPITTVVNVSYPVKGTFGCDTKLDRHLKACAKRHGGERTGGGSGFRQRDADFQFKSKAAAGRFTREVRADKRLRTESFTKTPRNQP